MLKMLRRGYRKTTPFGMIILALLAYCFNPTSNWFLFYLCASFSLIILNGLFSKEELA